MKDPTTVALQEIVFGSLSGIAGKLLEFPFDTVKVRLQSQPVIPQYTSSLDCFKQTITKDGWLGLYRGISAPLAGAMFENAVLFVSYSKAQEVVRAVQGSNVESELSLAGIMMSGAMSGAVTSFILTPIELVKCQMQVQTAYTSAAPPKSITTLIRDVYRTKGLRGFWRGQLSTLFRESGGSCCWFTVYETALRAMRPGGTTKKDNSQSQLLLAGAMAGVGYNTLFFPADTIKSRMQTNASEANFSGVVRDMWQRQGFRAFFKGWGITVARAAPSNALIFWVYESLCRAYM